MASWQVHFFAIPLLLIALGISIYYATAHQLLLISLGISVGHAAARFSDHDVSQKRGATADSDDTNSPVDTATQQTSKAPESKKDLPEIEHTATGNRTSAAASDSAQHLIATSPPNKSQCFRISAIPGSWSKKDLWNGLCSFDSELSVLKSQVSLDTYEACCGTGQTALLKFNPGASCTNIFEKLRRTSNNYELVQEITPKKDDACQQDADPKSVELVIDHHFLHLTPLYTPPSEEVLADIVAVTGLAGKLEYRPLPPHHV
ncbi:hypothetical protein EDC01DRAFT_188383 [Geopyxis carbonaria]|nr:hypothetical protein EDC01DRAFT_188383 [Geopyxis carbonaria]